MQLKWFSDLKVKNKLILSSCSLIFLSGIILSAIIGIIIYTYGKQEIKDYRENEFAKRKQTLKNYVEMIYHNLDLTYTFSQSKDEIIKNYGNQLKNVVDIAYQLIKKEMTANSNKEEAQANALEILKRISYDNGSGYIWVNDMGKPYPKMIMHPILPQLNGQMMDDPKYNCAMGKKENLFKAFVDICEINGEGFVDYLWPKPTKEGITKEQPKLTFVKSIPEWGWIIGTGIYVDDVIQKALEIMKNSVSKMTYENNEGYFWINDMGKPYPKMIMHPMQPELNDKIMDDPKYNCAMGTNKNMFQVFVEVCETNGEGVVDYLWPKLAKDGMTSPQPKLAYVKHFKALNWVIGTGIYMDDIETEVKQKETDIQSQVTYTLLYLILGIIGMSAILSFFINLIAKAITNPLQNMMGFIEKIDKKDFTAYININAEDEIGIMGKKLNATINLLRKNILSLKDICGTLDHSSTEMTSIS
ncbi:MAG: methyl-accepting chemotaxis protein, partial [Desulfobacterales bacterium]|nr:methyl-accepting chemotaxis protein [Desulfobacterales bacterium]